MRKICDSSRCFTSMRLISSALARSWPIGFSTTTREKFAASGLADQAGLRQPLNPFADRLGRDRQVVDAIGRDTARRFDCFKLRFKFCEPVGMVEPGQIVEPSANSAQHSSSTFRRENLAVQSCALLRNSSTDIWRRANPSTALLPGICPRRTPRDCTATESVCAWRDRPTRRILPRCTAAPVGLVVRSVDCPSGGLPYEIARRAAPLVTPSDA